MAVQDTGAEWVGLGCAPGGLGGAGSRSYRYLRTLPCHDGVAQSRASSGIPHPTVDPATAARAVVSVRRVTVTCKYIHGSCESVAVNCSRGMVCGFVLRLK